MKLSKTEARNNIQKGEYEGWDDPRTWSLQSLKKRGIRPEALKESLLSLGMSMSGITFSTGWLYSKNQDIIDEISDRYFFVEDPILLEIDEVPFEEYIAEPLLLPTKPKKGKVSSAYQVSYNVTDARTKSRETNALIKALKFFDLQEGTIITKNQETEEIIKGFRVKYIPVWKFMFDFLNMEKS